MASDAQETLYRIFAGLAGASTAGLAGASTAGLAGASTAGPGSSVGSGASSGSGSDTGSDLLGVLTGGSIGPAIAAEASKKNESGGAGQVALNVVKSGLGTVPLVAALFRLFGGGDDEPPAPLVKYALPARREFHAAATESGFGEVDYDQSGAPRVYERPLRESAGAATENGHGGGAGLPQINVNVQAMDARSFLDRSSDIAAAVREAMLNLNSINDVVTDL